MATLRTEETQEEYEKYKAAGGLDGSCTLCGAEPVETFQYWKIVNNKFPYDCIAGVHRMAVLKRHATEDEMTSEELKELKELKKRHINDHYEFMFESTPKTMTIPGHYHLQLMVVKENI